MATPIHKRNEAIQKGNFQHMRKCDESNSKHKIYLIAFCQIKTGKFLVNTLERFWLWH